MASHPIRHPHLSSWRPVAAPSARFERPLPRHRAAHRRLSSWPHPRTYAEPMPVRYDAAYHLDAGDRLRVVVYGQEGLTNTYAIDAGGSITMPLIGAVPARGRTTAGLAAEIAAKLRKGFIREPSVAVEIEAYRPFFILGEVAAPGQYPLRAEHDSRERGRHCRRLFATRAPRSCHSYAYRRVRNGALCRAARKCGQPRRHRARRRALVLASANKHKSRTGLTCAGNGAIFACCDIAAAHAMGVALH